MILLCGIPSESSIVRIAEELTAIEEPFTLVNQRHVRGLRLSIEFGGTRLSGSLTGPGYEIALADVKGVYLRFMDDRFLPEIESEPADSAVRKRSRAFHDLFGQWADVADACVINRYINMGSNFSKPYQAQLIEQAGFATPKTLITSEPAEVLAFADEHGPLIYKSMSGERSIVALADLEDGDRLERIKACPVQFQAFVGGPNVRVHTVGDKAFATLIETNATDYRYAAMQTGEPAAFEPVELEDEIRDRCIALAKALGLEIAGIDLKLPPREPVVCLEVNPSPVFTYYEQRTHQPIAAAVAERLASHRLTSATTTS